MGLSLATQFVRRGLLRAAFMFGVFLRIESLRNRHEGGGKLGRAHVPKHLPRLSLYCDLHAGSNLRDFQGQVIHRELLLDIRCPVRRA
jgi:hypothetical protein